MQTKPRADKTTLDQALHAGKREAVPSRVSPPPSLPSGEAKAFRMGVDAALAKSYANPQFETYQQRILYRVGWLAQMKHNAEVSGAGTASA